MASGKVTLLLIVQDRSSPDNTATSTSFEDFSNGENRYKVLKKINPKVGGSQLMKEVWLPGSMV
jgi:hypothetical protein